MKILKCISVVMLIGAQNVWASDGAARNEGSAWKSRFSDDRSSISTSPSTPPAAASVGGGSSREGYARRSPNNGTSLSRSTSSAAAQRIPKSLSDDILSDLGEPSTPSPRAAAPLSASSNSEHDLKSEFDANQKYYAPIVGLNQRKQKELLGWYTLVPGAAMDQTREVGSVTVPGTLVNYKFGPGVMDVTNHGARGTRLSFINDKLFPRIGATIMAIRLTPYGWMAAVPAAVGVAALWWSRYQKAKLIAQLQPTTIAVDKDGKAVLKPVEPVKSPSKLEKPAGKPVTT